jgi:hypothetical protein
MNAEFYFFTTLRKKPFVTVTQGIDTTAIFLLVKILALGNVEHPA